MGPRYVIGRLSSPPRAEMWKFEWQRTIEPTRRKSGQPFLGQTFGEVGWSYGSREKVLEQSRRRWGRRREIVEAKIARWGHTAARERR
jgi:hypothetical protein